MQKLKEFLLDSFDEMKNKVSWPKYNDLQNSSILVLVASLIFAVVIGAIDYAFRNAMEWFYSDLF